MREAYVREAQVREAQETETHLRSYGVIDQGERVLREAQVTYV